MNPVEIFSLSCLGYVVASKGITTTALAIGELSPKPAKEVMYAWITQGENYMFRKTINPNKSFRAYTYSTGTKEKIVGEIQGWEWGNINYMLYTLNNSKTITEHKAYKQLTDIFEDDTKSRGISTIISPVEPALVTHALKRRYKIIPDMGKLPQGQQKLINKLLFLDKHIYMFKRI